MSGKTKSPLRLLAVLKLPDQVPRLVVYARRVVEAMTDNQFFPSPSPSLAALAAALDALAGAEAARLSRTIGTVAARDEKRLALVALLQQLCAFVQAAADADPDNAAAIIESTGMSVKKRRVFPAPVFAARPGPVSGSVTLAAPQAAQRAGYEWAYSTDGAQTWVSLPFTVKANATVSGLAQGSTVHFRYRPVTKDGTGDWSQVISLRVD